MKIRSLFVLIAFGGSLLTAAYTCSSSSPGAPAVSTNTPQSVATATIPPPQPTEPTPVSVDDLGFAELSYLESMIPLLEDQAVAMEDMAFVLDALATDPSLGTSGTWNRAYERTSQRIRRINREIREASVPPLLAEFHNELVGTSRELDQAIDYMDRYLDDPQEFYLEQLNNHLLLALDHQDNAFELLDQLLTEMETSQ